MARSLALFSLVALCACEGAPAGPGLFAWMRVEDAQYYRGVLEVSQQGPQVVTVENARNVVSPGLRNKSLRGSLAPTASAVALMLDGDRGYWIVPAGPPDVQVPDLLTFDARLSFSPDLPSGSYVLSTYAIDADGRVGEPARVMLSSEALTVPPGELVVSLRWDTQADLDLHVVDPLGVDLWTRNQNSVEPPAPGIPPDPDAWQSGARLDFDSNAQCVIDGRRNENALWLTAPPSGEFLVRVDTFSLCGQAAAHWVVEAWHLGRPVGAAMGVSTNFDVEQPHERGSGVLALRLRVD